MVMKKAEVYILFVALAILTAGLYGAVHNQISYTISPEYFIKFKFWQFKLNDSSLTERFRASLVGFLAAWWMGIPLGLLVGAAGFIHSNPRHMLWVSLWSLLVTTGFTLLFGFGGLLYGFFKTKHIDLADYAEWYIPENVDNLRKYLCAGYMHNSSYIGGGLAIFVGWVFHAVVKFRTKKDTFPT